MLLSSWQCQVKSGYIRNIQLNVTFWCWLPVWHIRRNPFAMAMAKVRAWRVCQRLRDTSGSVSTLFSRTVRSACACSEDERKEKSFQKGWPSFGCIAAGTIALEGIAFKSQDLRLRLSTFCIVCEFPDKWVAMKVPLCIHSAQRPRSKSVVESLW